MYSPNWCLIGEAAKKAAFLIEGHQSFLDDVSRALSVDPFRIEYAAVVVESPDWLLVLPDHFLAKKIGAAEIAVEIPESAAHITEIMRSGP
ncbi:hypothetical protein ASE36_12040 [Rhizobium sp. Root274]|nr:hypothetical protein ASC71_12060 [Rhizobium sp. Root1240]KRD29377.1 hypothetical protein ASE36_12040 [Rhizobium sp. Root274]